MITEIRDILVILSFLLSVGGVFYAWATRSNRETRGKVEALKERVDKMNDDLIHMPDKDAMHRLELSLARMDGQLEKLDERIKPLSGIAGRMQDYMMQDRTR